MLVTALVMVPLLGSRWRCCRPADAGPLDNGIQFVTLALAGVPEFVTGILLVALFSTSVFHLLPAVTVLPVGYMPWDRQRASSCPSQPW